MPKHASDDGVYVCVRMSPELVERIDSVGTERERSSSYVVRKFIEAGLEREEEKPRW